MPNSPYIEETSRPEEMSKIHACSPWPRPVATSTVSRGETPFTSEPETPSQIGPTITSIAHQASRVATTKTIRLGSNGNNRTLSEMLTCVLIKHSSNGAINASRGSTQGTSQSARDHHSGSGGV
jgi:hypothetical protein